MLRRRNTSKDSTWHYRLVKWRNRNRVCEGVAHTVTLQGSDHAYTDSVRTMGCLVCRGTDRRACGAVTQLQTKGQNIRWSNKLTQANALGFVVSSRAEVAHRHRPVAPSFRCPGRPPHAVNTTCPRSASSPRSPGLCTSKRHPIS
jgi:hypothetical protein